MSFSGPTIKLAVYTDAELTTMLDGVRTDIKECESYEEWKKALLGQEHWLAWELDRRKASEC